MNDPALPTPSGQRRPTADGREARTLRHRQEGLRAAMDRGAVVPAIAAPRRLVSVYNGGRMPGQADHVFLTHPVECDGLEIEAGTASPDVDTTATIPVVVLRGAPQAGDLLVATAVGGRWVAERGGGGGRTTICVAACGGVPVVGAVITVFSGSTAIGQCTTGAGGCCQFPVAGSYTVQVQMGGTLVYSALRTLALGGTTTILLGGNSGLVCCGGYAIPQALTLTDAAGSLAFVYDPSSNVPTWYGGHSVQRPSCPVTTPQGLCLVGPSSTGPVRVCYRMTCTAGRNPTFSIQRSWSWVYQQGTLTAIWYQDSSGFSPGRPCSTSPPGVCGSPLTDTASFDANPPSPSPFALSGTPVDAPGNLTGDPVGGMIVISA